MHRTILALLAVAFALSAADKTYVLKAAHMFDGKSDHVVSPGLVVVSNGKITAVGSIDSIEHGTFLDDEALDMMKSRGTFYVPTLMAAEGLKERLTDGYVPPVIAAKARLAIAALDATVRKAIARGVKIVVGTDAAVTGGT